MTLESTGAHGLTLLTSIYDGQQAVQINNSTNTIIHHGNDTADTSAREAAQYHGGTARFGVGTSTAMAWDGNIYNEAAGFTVVTYPVPPGLPAVAPAATGPMTTLTTRVYPAHAQGGALRRDQKTCVARNLLMHTTMVGTDILVHPA